MLFSDDGLASRCPNKKEEVYYGIARGVPVFLPREGLDMLPESAIIHVKSASSYISTEVTNNSTGGE